MPVKYSLLFMYTNIHIQLNITLNTGNKLIYITEERIKDELNKSITLRGRKKEISPLLFT